jgi:hypothetical protein
MTMLSPRQKVSILAQCVPLLAPKLPGFDFHRDPSEVLTETRNFYMLPSCNASL